MPALALRQAHSCRPRPRPVLAPHPDAAAQNTEHAPRPRPGSGTRAAPTGPQATNPRATRVRPPTVGGRRARRAQGIPRPATTGPAAAHTCTLFSTSRVAQRSRDSVVRADRRRCGKIQPPPKARGVVPSTPASLPEAHDSPPAPPSHLPFLSFFFFASQRSAPDLPPCRLLDAARAPTD